ncbi:putative prephenate dehydrogenase TyrA [Rhodococcoides trifolii]|uniref:Prephenate dehydrogenase TyrA n=1 Tax=Rhodococcoides trifolii TaxID=908250 RepID=A0A917G242_9NOCA|nr:prephenate dehydrogenase [Rhodococcus trifolii]GGG18239.1 putative prephenate dehydrogenase TyrA [Rhodococcus trifolii]
MDRPVCILGLGLIGGSLLRAVVSTGRIAWGYNRSFGSVEAARSDGYDAENDLEAVLRRAAVADALVVIAVPMTAVDSVLDAVARYAPNCALTDVVSVKAEMAGAVAAHGLSARYIGGHPMAGTSASGWIATDEDLFRNAVWVVSVDDGVDPDVWTTVARLALSVGSVVVPAASDEHDRAVARVSHLPHLLAETLAAVGAAGGDLALRLAAGSFRDGTRVAGTSPTLVNAMCEANAAGLTAALDDAIERLVQAREALSNDSSTAELVDAGHTARRRYDDQLQWWEITDVTIGVGDWVTALRDAGRRGGVLQSL